MMTTFTLYLPLLLAWAQSPDGTNALFALVCFMGLFGLSGRICLGLTLALHLLLILL